MPGITTPGNDLPGISTCLLQFTRRYAFLILQLKGVRESFPFACGRATTVLLIDPLCEDSHFSYFSTFL